MEVFWDTVGQERFRSAVIKTIRFVNGIILVLILQIELHLKI